MESVESNEDLLHKWDVILVEIFKKEWPKNWTSFIHDLVNSALESESRCRNCIFIIKLVVEDVDVYSMINCRFSNSVSLCLHPISVVVFRKLSKMI